MDAPVLAGWVEPKPPNVVEGVLELPKPPLPKPPNDMVGDM